MADMVAQAVLMGGGKKLGEKLVEKTLDFIERKLSPKQGRRARRRKR